MIGRCLRLIGFRILDGLLLWAFVHGPRRLRGYVQRFAFWLACQERGLPVP